MSPREEERLEGEYSWSNWCRYVLKNLEEINNQIAKAAQERMQIMIDIELLKEKSRFWGGIAGAIVGTIVSIAAQIIFLIIGK